MVNLDEKCQNWDKINPRLNHVLRKFCLELSCLAKTFLEPKLDSGQSTEL